MRFKLSVLFAITISLISTSAFAATRYVRCPSLGSSQDGGTGYDASANPTGQCNGTADSPYDGSGTNENCAWQNPMWAMSWKDASYPQKISGGDTLIITGNCEIGFGADDGTFAQTSSSYPWDAYMKPVPSGPDPEHKTKIYGSNWALGANATKADTSKLTGVERVTMVLNLEGTSNFDIRALTVTDGLNCGENHPNAAVKCQRDTYPYGKWAQNGISMLDSTNGYLENVYVDGLANRGVFEGRIQDILWKWGSISGNSFVNWEGDRGDPDNWANGGTITFKGTPDRKFMIRWGGCVNGAPESGNPVAGSCYSQDQGGNGDGVAVSDKTGVLGGAKYVFDNVDISDNVSDGLDLLYHKGVGTTAEISNSKFANNAGNDIKIAGNAILKETIASGGCDAFNDKAYKTACIAGPCGGGQCCFNNCRAAGNTVAWDVQASGNKLEIYGSNITGKGDVLIQTSGSVCGGTEKVIMKNSILQGDTQYNDTDLTDDFYNSGATGNGDGPCGSIQFDATSSGSANIIYGTKTMITGSGVTNSNPLFTNKYSDWSIPSNSPARGLRNVAFGSTIDYNGFARSTAIGALEYGSSVSGASCDNDCSLCGSSPACSGSAATCYWWSTNTCNTTPEGPICADTCSQCVNQSTCQASAATCYWWSNSTCNAMVEPNSCTNTCSQCNSQSTCQASGAGCYWWTNSTCNSMPEGVVQKTFEITGRCAVTGRAK